MKFAAAMIVAGASAFANYFQEEVPNESAPLESCSHAIDVLQLGIQNSDRRAFAGTQYEDLELITNTPKISLISELFDKVSYWKSLSDFDSAVLFGPTNLPKPQDIQQGMIKDSFFVATAQSLALQPNVVKGLVLEKPENSVVTQEYKF